MTFDYKKAINTIVTVFPEEKTKMFPHCTQKEVAAFEAIVADMGPRAAIVALLEHYTKNPARLFSFHFSKVRQELLLAARCKNLLETTNLPIDKVMVDMKESLQKTEPFLKLVEFIDQKYLQSQSSSPRLR